MLDIMAKPSKEQIMAILKMFSGYITTNPDHSRDYYGIETKDFEEIAQYIVFLFDEED